MLLRHSFPQRFLAIVLAIVPGLLCGAPSFGAELNVILVDAETRQPVADAVVSVHGAASPAARPGTAVMDQRDRQFQPLVLPITRGTAVSFPNSDDVRHHVYSFSPPKQFELPLYHGTPSEPVLFDQTGVVVLGCNIHDRMIGYIYILDTPWFARTDATGIARLGELQPGLFELRVWHPQLAGTGEYWSSIVTVGLTETLEITLPLASLPAAMPEPTPGDPAARLRDKLQQLREQRDAGSHAPSQ